MNRAEMFRIVTDMESPIADAAVFARAINMAIAALGKDDKDEKEVFAALIDEVITNCDTAKEKWLHLFKMAGQAARDCGVDISMTTVPPEQGESFGPCLLFIGRDWLIGRFDGSRWFDNEGAGISNPSAWATLPERAIAPAAAAE